MSGRLTSIVLGVAVVLLVTAVVVDAVRKQSGHAAPVTAHGRLGTLYYVDRHCELHAVTVPELRRTAAPPASGCRALISPATPAPGWSVWPSTARLAAWCDGNRVLVAAATGPRLPMIGGCAPAWRPDGSLTYIRRGTVAQFPRVGRAEDVLTASQVAAALGRDWRADRIAWLGPDRLAVAASDGARAVLAVFSDKRVVAQIPVEPGVDLRASPRGSFVVVRGANGLRVYDARRLHRLRSSGSETAIAWSPDEHWRADATAKRVVLSTRLEHVVLPFGALDLAWTR